MRSPRTIRTTAAGLAILLLAAMGPRLAGAITGTDSHDTGTGGDKPTAANPAPGSPLAPMSVTTDGKPADGDSSTPTIGGENPDVVGFVSDAKNLTPDDDNDHRDVFVNDNGVVDRVSTDPPGATLTDVVGGPSLCSTGDVVGYGARVEEDGSEVSSDRVVVVDRRTGVTELAPAPRDGGDLGTVAVSPDCTVVTWEQDGNVYVHPVGSGATEPVLVTRDPGGRPAGGGSQPGPCGQGQRVVFASESPSLVPDDLNGTSDVFVAAGMLTGDRADDGVTRISRAHAGGEADGASTDPAITPDCNKVVFTSFATNLVPGDTNGTSDVFLHDLTTGTTTIVSNGNGPSGHGSISDDGGYVAFDSAADNLVPDDHNGEDPRNATPSSFQALDRGGVLTYATSVLKVDGPRVRVGFPETLDFARVSAGSVDAGALIDEQVRSVDNLDGRSNTNPLATRGPTTLDQEGRPVEPGPDVTDGPDLLSAEVVPDDAGTPDNPADDVAVVRYCFDERVNGIRGRGDSVETDNVATDRFVLEGYNSLVRLRSTRATIEREIVISQTDGGTPTACVLARFAPGVEADRFVGAAVLPAAVIDRDKRENVKGSVSLLGGGFDPQDGDITGPNLRSAQSDLLANRVTYVFDDIEVTDPLVSDLATRFGFVDPDGVLRPGRFVTAADKGAESVTVEFDFNTANVANARRFVVLPDAVRNAGGEPNVEQSTDGDAAGPELLAVTRVGPVGAPGPPRFDFVFNTEVRQPDVGRFLLYTEDGTAFAPGSLDRPSPRVVRVSAPAVERFPESLVLGVAQPRAVFERLLEPDSGEISGAANSLGAKGITRRFSPAGSLTDGPDLVGVEPLPDLRAIDFLFDEPVRDVQLVLSRTAPNLPTDVFVRELVSGDLLRASVDGEGRELDGSSFLPRISGDGRFVVFSFSAFFRGVRVRVVILRRDLLVAQVNPQAIDFGDVVTGPSGSDPMTVEVTNRGFGRLVIGTVALAGTDPGDFKITSRDCNGRTLRRKQACVMSVVFAPGVEGDKAADVVVTDNALGSPRAVSLTGRGFLEGVGPLGAAPVLTVSPGLGPPGTVALVRGQGFLPGSTVQLRWVPAPESTNTTPLMGAPVAVSADGAGVFGPAALLVLPGDVLGRRLVEARGAQPEAAATVPFLVVPGTVQPEATPTRVTTGFGDVLRTLVRRLHLVSRR